MPKTRRYGKTRQRKVRGKPSPHRSRAHTRKASRGGVTFYWDQRHWDAFNNYYNNWFKGEKNVACLTPQEMGSYELEQKKCEDPKYRNSADYLFFNGQKNCNRLKKVLDKMTNMQCRERFYDQEASFSYTPQSKRRQPAPPTKVVPPVELAPEAAPLPRSTSKATPPVPPTPPPATNRTPSIHPDLQKLDTISSLPPPRSPQLPVGPPAGWLPAPQKQDPFSSLPLMEPSRTSKENFSTFVSLPPPIQREDPVLSYYRMLQVPSLPTTKDNDLLLQAVHATDTQDETVFDNAFGNLYDRFKTETFDVSNNPKKKKPLCYSVHRRNQLKNWFQKKKCNQLDYQNYSMEDFSQVNQRNEKTKKLNAQRKICYQLQDSAIRDYQRKRDDQCAYQI